MNNKYYKRWGISEAKFRQLIKYFSLDLTATAELTSISLRSVTVIFDKLRGKIARWSEQLAPVVGTIEVDESQVGPRRIPSKRGRGASGKTIVFGIFKRQGKVYTEIVPDARKKRLQRVIRGKVRPASVIHNNGLEDVGYHQHYRVNHGQDEFAKSNRHISEGFAKPCSHRLVIASR